MKLTSKKEVHELVGCLTINDNYKVYKPCDEKPNDWHFSYTVSYSNMYGVRCQFIVDNLNCNVYVELDYMHAFE